MVVGDGVSRLNVNWWPVGVSGCTVLLDCTPGFNMLQEEGMEGWQRVAGGRRGMDVEQPS